MTSNEGGHPKDVWVEVTCLGDAAPRHILAQDGRETEIAEAKTLYTHDRIDINELETRIQNALQRQ